jgi:tRNA threonylcarbamoyladenosine biosynthesis protein TsaB
VSGVSFKAPVAELAKPAGFGVWNCCFQSTGFGLDLRWRVMLKMVNPLPNSGISPLVLGIDTCGPEGSVALARLVDPDVQVLGEMPLEGRTYSATLVAAIEALLKAHGARLREVGCLVVVNGPGSFTGVRVGLSAAKGLAEGAGLRVIAVSRLAVLAGKAGTANTALDAHRHEVYLRLGARELLAGAEEMAALAPPDRLGVCEDGAEAVLATAWPGADLVRVSAPTASDAIRLAAERINASKFDDVALLDGHYLRRSDAEIFGEKGRPGKAAGSGAG